MLQRRNHLLFTLVLSALILVSSFAPALGQTWVKELATGVTLKQTVSNSGTPEVINVVTVNPAAPGVRLQAVLAKDMVYQDSPSKGCESVSSMAGRLKAIAAVNSDFFPIGTDVPGDPLNLMVIGGELVSEPSQRVILAINADGKPTIDNATFDFSVKLKTGKPFPVRGVNRPRAKNELVLFTDRYHDTTRTSDQGSEAVVKLDNPPLRMGANTGTVTELRSNAGDTPLTPGVVVFSGHGTGAEFVDGNLKVGTPITLNLKVTGQRSGSLEKMKDVVGGGCWLVKDGKEFVDIKAAGFGASFSTTAHPRTAVGITKDGKLVLVTVDGRQSISGGAPLPQLAKLMIAQGCVQAANLDGGGSTTMATYYGILNSPSGGIERQVANGMAVFADEQPVTDSVEFSIAPIAKVLSGTSVKIALMDASGERPLIEETSGKVIWSTRGGAGFVDQSGTFYGVKARKGEVVAKLGSRIVTLPMETIAGVPAHIAATIKKDESGAPNRGTLAIAVTDINDNTIGNAQISVQVAGGVPDNLPTVTDEHGAATTGITWQGEPGAHVVVTCGSVSADVKKPAK